MRNTQKLHCCSTLCLSTILSITLFSVPATSFDTITSTQPLRLNQTIISQGQVFELGFFSPSNSIKQYVCIWYHKIQTRTIVWVANRDNPLTNPSGSLKMNEDGNIVVVDESSNLTWSSNQTISSTKRNTVAQLLDSGNFVLRRENDLNPENYLWQSFDHPTDTLLPGMKLGWDANTGLNRYLTSWKSYDDPATGEYSFKLNINGFPEIFLRWNQVIQYRSGPWNGLRFSGVPAMKPSSVLLFSFVMNSDNVFYSFGLIDNSEYSRLLMMSTGILQLFTSMETTQLWYPFWYAPTDQCDRYRECGVYGICDTNDSPVRKCMEGFERRNLQAWGSRDGNDGYVRKRRFKCGDDGFLLLKNMKLPESSNAVVVDYETMNLNDCEMVCRKNCSCTAYASKNISGGGDGSSGGGCVIWTTELVHMRQYAPADGQDLYVRVSAADLAHTGSIETEQQQTGRKRKIITISISISLSVFLVVTLLSSCIYYQRRRKATLVQKDNRNSSEVELIDSAGGRFGNDYNSENLQAEKHAKLQDFPSFQLDIILAATEHFSEKNKLGEGGFGPVYKGTLLDGREIAVKRLSRTSSQGLREFKNEIILIARLQHRNLVRLLGCCLKENESLLIYEYMPNKSLDVFLFDSTRGEELDWKRRFLIINGIARGILYLHEDSRLRIIHRDLKASNVLLDHEMNPKISDFGMARIFGGNQNEANTKRIVGSYGYMAPEYAMEGLFSVKSDVFSFGVILLEIISGKKNSGFHLFKHGYSLLTFAWKLWSEGQGSELMDPILVQSCVVSEVLKCIHIGLLCVQEDAADRPTMSFVVVMLGSDTVTLPQPKQPAFSVGRQVLGLAECSQNINIVSVNEITLSDVSPR